MVLKQVHVLNLNYKKSIMIKPKNTEYIEYKENFIGKYTLSMDGKLVEKLLILIDRKITEWWINCGFLGIEYIDSNKEALIYKQYKTAPRDENYY